MAFCLSINLDLERDTSLNRSSYKLLTHLRRPWIKNWSLAVFFLTFQRHLTQLTMIFCYRNSIDMLYVEILSDGLKTTYTIIIRSSKLVTLYLAVRPISMEYLKGQLWVHCYFCFILLIWQTVQANYPSESLLMTLICFIQLIICITLSLSWLKNLSQ